MVREVESGRESFSLDLDMPVRMVRDSMPHGGKKPQLANAA